VTRRTLRLTAVAALAVVALAGCRTYQGTAAYVGDTRITTTEVEKQVDEFYADEFWAKQAEGQRAVVHNRTVNALVIEELLKQLASESDVTVPDSAVDEVAAAFDAEKQRIPQALLGAPTRVAASVSAYAEAIQRKLSGGDPQAGDLLSKALQDAAREHPVTVNPRYGKFDAASLSLNPLKDAGVRELEETPAPGEEPQPDQQQPDQQQPDQPQPDQPQPDQPPQN
jgi:hypothetical protein